MTGPRRATEARLYFQTLDDKSECVGVYTNGKLVESIISNANIVTRGNIFLFKPYSFVGNIEDFIFYNEPVSYDGAITLCRRKKIKL